MLEPEKTLQLRTSQMNIVKTKKIVEIESLICKDEKMERKVRCQTMEGKLFEVSHGLMMQSKLYSEMWTNLDIGGGENNGKNEEVKENKNEMKETNSKPFILKLPTIKAKCFRQCVNWMRHQRGKPKFELKIGQETGQHTWFTPDEWECKFGFGPGKNKMDMEMEQLKEFYLAANFLNLESLYHYCIQELALLVIQANNLQNVRQFLCIADDMSQEEKAEIYREFGFLHTPNEKILNSSKGTNEKISLPPELICPIFAKLSLSDQRWLLTLNRDAYKFLGERVSKNWPKWKDALNAFIIEEMSGWYYGRSQYHIRGLRPNDTGEWNTASFLADQALQTDLAKTWDFVNDAINAVKQQGSFGGWSPQGIKHLKSQLERAIAHVEELFRGEEHFQTKLAEIMPRYENMLPMCAYKRGVHHLIGQRRQTFVELKKSGLKKLKAKLADLEKDLKEYWLRRL